MSRAVFLSCGGDVLIASLVIKFFKDRWYDEVDEFMVCHNNHCGVPQEVVSEFLSRLSGDKKVSIIYHPRGIGNGMPITEMTLMSKADYVMLLEDDGFIFTPGIVSRWFQQIESDLTDIVGSPRFSCGNEIAEASKKKYNLDYSAYGDVGCNAWPNFFVCKRKDLLRTDMDFGSHTWKAGEYSKELDHTFKEINHGDTFVWACVQLRALGLRFQNISQYHADPYEIENKEKKQMNWINGEPTHIHAGSLSAGWGGYLSGIPMQAHDDSSLREMESSCAFWTIASDCVEGFNAFKVEYKKGIELLVQNAKLDSGNIQKKINIYKTLMKL